MRVCQKRLCHGLFRGCVIFLSYYLIILSSYDTTSEYTMTQPHEILSSYSWSDPVGARRCRAKALRRHALPPCAYIAVL